MKTVNKVWGAEQWIVNNEDYCGKLLIIKGGAMSSYHAHPIKRETFIVLLGHVEITVEGEGKVYAPLEEPITIEPGQKHKFTAVTDATILEVSTPHSDGDVVRYEESKSA